MGNFYLCTLFLDFLFVLQYIFFQLLFHSFILLSGGLQFPFFQIQYGLQIYAHYAHNKRKSRFCEKERGKDVYSVMHLRFWPPQQANINATKQEGIICVKTE